MDNSHKILSVVLFFCLSVLFIPGCFNPKVKSAPFISQEIDTTATIHQVIIKDSLLYSSLQQLVSNKRYLFPRDTCLLDFYKLGFQENLYYVEMTPFVPDARLKECIGYYCEVDGVLFFFPTKLPPGLLEIQDNSINIILSYSCDWLDAMPFYCLSYEIT